VARTAPASGLPSDRSYWTQQERRRPRGMNLDRGVPIQGGVKSHHSYKNKQSVALRTKYPKYSPCRIPCIDSKLLNDCLRWSFHTASTPSRPLGAVPSVMCGRPRRSAFRIPRTTLTRTGKAGMGPQSCTTRRDPCGRAWPGHPLLCQADWGRVRGVDARDKPGHGGVAVQNFPGHLAACGEGAG